MRKATSQDPKTGPATSPPTSYPMILSPGGHLEPGETLIDTLNRETEEELRVERAFSGHERPFMLSISDIANPSQECRTHFDMWYLLQNDGWEFQPDSREFLETRWLAFDEAREVVTDRATLRALDIVESAGN